MSSRSFNGTSNRLDNSNPPITAIPLTIAGWCRPVGSTSGVICQIQDKDTTARFYRVRLETGGTARFDTQSGGTGQNVSTTNEYTVNIWCHVAGSVSSGGAISVYLDGQKNTTTGAANPNSWDSVTVGAAGDSSPSNYFNGQIGQVAIWDIVLSDAEIESLAGGAPPDSVQPGHIVAYWPIEGVSSPEPDMVGTYDLTVNGASFSTETPPINTATYPLFTAGFFMLC